MDTLPDTPAPWSRLRMAFVWLGVVVSFGFLLFCYRYLGVLAAGEQEPYLKKLVEEMSGALVGGGLFFPVRWMVRRRPFSRANWPQSLAVYVLAAVAFGLISTTLMWGLRTLAYPLFGLGAYDYGRMPIRYLMELPMEAIAFAVMVFVIQAVDSFRDARAREVRAARLESSLSQAQLRNLRLQLQPHFLFNALNTISSTMYRDPAAADEMIGQLAELLRTSLRTTQADEVPLHDEVGVLRQYLGIMSARFGDRLQVAIDVPVETQACLVPSMILQPLVENAVRHGNASRAGRGRIQVRARRDGDDLVLEVDDDGPGVQDGAQGSWGVGLTATSERLRLLYGDARRFEARNSENGGFLARARIPFRSAPVEGA